MGYFANLAIEILELHAEGVAAEDIASQLNVPVIDVLDIIETDSDKDPDPGEMDGDFDSAMASAGFGTDEDYGYYGEEQ